MGKVEMLKCETCGSHINIETGETFPPVGSNASKITEMSNTIRDLTDRLSKMNKLYDDLKEKAGNGNDGTGKATVDDII